jgi:hypothetical protein
VPNSLKNQFPGEPLYVDLRWAKTEENLSLRHSQFRAAILDIAAPVHGRAKDELDGEDVRQYRKTRRWAWTAGIVLAVLAVAATVAAVLAVQQRDQAEVRRQIDFSRQVAAQALSRLEEEHLDSEARDCGVQPAARDDQQREARANFLIVDAHVSSFVKWHGKLLTRVCTKANVRGDVSARGYHLRTQVVYGTSLSK